MRLAITKKQSKNTNIPEGSIKFDLEQKQKLLEVRGLFLSKFEKYDPNA